MTRLYEWVVDVHDRLSDPTEAMMRCGVGAAVVVISAIAVLMGLG